MSALAGRARTQRVASGISIASSIPAARVAGAVAGAASAVAVVLTVALALTSLAVTRDVEAAAAKAKKSGTKSSNQVLARVGKSVITRADFDARMDELPPQFRTQFSTPEGKKNFLDRMVEERIWLEAAQQAGVEKRPEIVKRLADQKRDLVIRTYLGELQAAAPAPSDSAIANYYETHNAEYTTEEQAHVRHIQLADEKKAREVKRKLEKGGDFVALAKEYSTDAASKDRGGDLGYAMKGGVFGGLGRQPEMGDTAFKAPLNAILGPFKTTAGWHLIQVTERKPPETRKLEEVRPLIVRQLTQSTNMAFYQDQLAEHRRRLHVSVDSTAIESMASAQRTPAEIFREAGELPSTDERISAYQQIVSRYPESEYAPQALFMVGFVESEEKREYDKAETAFRDLIAKYPKSELVPSAQWMIENMRSDKTPEFDLPGGMGKASEHDSPERPQTAEQKSQGSKP